MQADPTMSDYNGMKKAVLMINHVQEMTKKYPAKQNIAVLAGDDFAYVAATETFK